MPIFLDTYILKICCEISRRCTLAQSTRYKSGFSPAFYDVVSTNYDVSPSCRFSHATAQILKKKLVC